MKASFTIEASFLLPLIVFLIWNILFLAFFLYDRSLSMEAGYMTALRTERSIENVDGKEMLSEEKLDRDFIQRIAVSDSHIEKNISEKETGITLEIQMEPPDVLFFQENWHSKQQQKADGFFPVEFIRNCRKAENLWKYVNEKLRE